MVSICCFIYKSTYDHNLTAHSSLRAMCVDGVFQISINIRYGWPSKTDVDEYWEWEKYPYPHEALH